MKATFPTGQPMDLASDDEDMLLTDTTEREEPGTPYSQHLKSIVQDRRKSPIRVLYATDGSKASATAAQLLARLPLRSGSKVKVLTVLDASEWQVPEALEGAELEWARRVVARAETEFAREGVERSGSIVRGEPAFEILQAAGEFAADLVVVGSHGRSGIERVLLGSVAENVVKHAARPVLVARGPRVGLQRILLAVDGSAPAARATELVACLPFPAGTEVVVCHVVRPCTPVVGPEYALNLDQRIIEVTGRRRADGEALVAQAAEKLRQAGLKVTTEVREGDPGFEIPALAKAKEADLVVAGARGLSTIRALLVGSVTSRLLESAPCSVLITH